MKNKEIEELLNKIQECDSLHNNCDYLLEHDECYILTEYIEQLEEEIHKKEAMYDSLAVDYRLSQEKNEQLEKEVEEYDLLITMQNNREYRSKFLKEFQEEHGKNVFPDYDEIYKRYDEIKTELQEANESIIWWTNRFNAVERDNRNLKNNRDKAIKFGNGLLLGEATFEERHIANRFLNILKGDSDD